MKVECLFIFTVLVTLCFGVPNVQEKPTRSPNFGCHHCPSHMVCAGQLFRMHCITPMTLGKRCGSDPYWTCETGLICRNHICVRPPVSVGKVCTPKEVICEDGAVCVGSQELKVCMKPGNIGDECGKNQFLVCREGLTCRNGVCARPVVPRGQNCSAYGSVCEHGTVCSGPAERKICIKTQSLGKPCGMQTPFVCASGLRCLNGVCMGYKVPVGKSCLARDAVCENGAVCVGTRNRKRCVIPEGLGKRCGENPFKVCKAGLRCSKRICVRHRIPLGGNCLGRNSVCVRGALCAGTAQKKICVKPRPVGNRCGTNHFSVCEKKLRCLEGVCVKLKIPEGGNCKRKGSVCEEGTICTEIGKSWICMLPRSQEDYCGQNPLQLCKKGLRCLDGVCRKRLIGRGGDCLSEGSVCRNSLICAEGYGRRKCVRGRGIGSTCGIKPFWVCDRGLRCVNHVCQG